MAKVTTTFVSDDASMLASIAKLNQKLDELEGKSVSGARSSAAAFGDMVGAIGKVAAGIGTAIGMMQTFNRELEHRNQLEEKHLQQQKSTAGSEREFSMNLGLVSSADRSRAFEGMQRISRERGVSLDSLYTVGAAALSASGGDLDQTLQATEYAARTAPHSVQTMDELASSMLHLQKVTGDNDLSKTMSLLIGMGQISPVKDWQQLSTNATPGLIGISGYGGTVAEHGALYATLANAMGDTRGDQAKTAGIALAEGLEKFLPKLDSTADRIAAIQADPKLVDKFMNTPGISFEKVAKVPIRRLLTGGSDEAQRFAENEASLQAMLETDQTAGFWAGLDNTNLQATAGAARATEAAKDRFMLSGTAAGNEAWARQTYGEMLDSLGYSSIAKTAALTSMDFRAGGGVESKFDQLTGQIRAERDALTDDNGRARADLTADQKRQLEYLQSISATLIDLRNSQRAGGSGINANPESK